MKYQKSFNIWNMSKSDIAKIQPGQWVYAGNKSDNGIFLGIKPSGTIVCAWYKNAKQREYKSYIRTLRDYATAK
tara:strand:- start:312 stop:533 length:222 start_codon:yes stop_codon:yes gene_type:complete